MKGCHWLWGDLEPDLCLIIVDENLPVVFKVVAGFGCDPFAEVKEDLTLRVLSVEGFLKPDV